MTLPTGSRLGPYEILAPLGAGGMGEVYRARDPRLNRELAIKVLPAAIAKDADFLNRFQGEARAASALNHPNIVTIHDLGSADGVSYILMELIEGKTLRELLDGGPPPLKKTLQIAAQVADGLAAAHARGIVHRDLKPENLMISRDGVVKILDFGLAKSSPLHAGAGADTGSYEAVATQPGSVLGTVGYMSPEQATGRSVDFRSDQFSFGTILYEMITGKRAWKRNSAAETLTAIIREEPHPPIATVVPGAPVALRWIVDRCLAKEPDERYGSTRDLARDLTTLKDHLSEISGVDVQADGRRRPSRVRRARSHRRSQRRGVGSRPSARASAPRQRAAAAAAQLDPGGLPSRRRLVGPLCSGWPDDRLQRRLGRRSGAPVLDASGIDRHAHARSAPGKLLSISSKSELAFVRNQTFMTLLLQPGILVRAGLEGGIGRDLLEHVQAADWSPDGTQLAVARNVDGKVRLEYPLGKTIYETRSPISDVRISRDGTWIAFLERVESGVVVAAIRVSDGSRRVLTEGWFTAAGLAWSADGREIWFTPQKQVRDSSPPLLAVSLSGKQREVVRAPGQLRLYDIAPDGRLLLARWDLQVGVRGFSTSTGHERELSATDDSMLSDLSSDGRTVLLYDRHALVLRATDGSPPLRLGEGYDGARLSPDGKSVLAVSREGPRYPVLIPVGAGEVRPIETETECEGVEWFPDGKRILCKIPNPNGPFRLFIIEVASGKVTAVKIAEDAARSFDEGAFQAESATLSPDGAYLAGVGGGGDILILPLAGGEARRIAGTLTGLDGLARPVGWTSDGRHLFIHHVGDLPDKAQRLEIATGRLEPWRDLTLEDPAGLLRINPVRVAPDGRSWAYSYIRVLSNLYVVDGLK